MKFVCKCKSVKDIKKYNSSVPVICDDCGQVMVYADANDDIAVSREAKEEKTEWENVT